MWSMATEDGIVDVCEYCQTERKQFIGHGIARYTLRRHKAPKVLQNHRGHAAFSTKATEQHQLKKHIHKILQHVRRSRQTDTNSWPPDICNTWERATQNEKWNMHTNMTIQTPTSWVTLIKNLQRAIRSIDQYVKQLIHSEYKERRKRFAAKLADNPAGGREFQAIRESPARPIQFLVDKEEILHTDPDEN